MEQTNILLMSDSGATGLMLSLRDICGRNRRGDFTVSEELLPAGGTSDFSSMLLCNFGPAPPHLAILCLSQNVREPTESFFEFTKNNRGETPVLLALESAEEEELLALLRLGAVDFMFAPLRAHEVGSPAAPVAAPSTISARGPASRSSRSIAAPSRPTWWRTNSSATTPTRSPARLRRRAG